MAGALNFRRPALLFLLPPLAVYVAFVIWPAAQVLLYSFQTWDGISAPRPAGLDNFVRLFGDPIFLRALGNNIAWMLAAVTVPVSIGLGLAILVTRAPLIGRGFFRLAFYMPQVLNPVAVAIIWGWIYDPSFGALNRILGSVGLGGLTHTWLGTTATALPSVFVAWTWLHYGFVMVLFIAALQGIDEEYFDMARIDGAGPWPQFRHVIVPFIRGPLVVVVLITAISSFQVFDLVYLLTSGGPANSSIVLPLHMLDHAFVYRNVGYASAIAVTMTAVILVMSIVILRNRARANARG
jgi:raffinose/stachyose/melibiose transport system permease protein